MKDHGDTGNADQHLEAVQLSNSACPRRTLSESGLFVVFFHPYSQHQSSFATTLRLGFFFFQIPFHIFFLVLWFFSRWYYVNDQNSSVWEAAVTASLADVLPEGFNRQLKFLCFSSFCGNNSWRSASKVKAIQPEPSPDRWFLRSPPNCTKYVKAASANAQNSQEREQSPCCLQ